MIILVCNRIKYTDEKKCVNHLILFGIGYEAWLICDNEDASKKIFEATGILVFDFEFFIGELCVHVVCVFQVWVMKC